MQLAGPLRTLRRNWAVAAILVVAAFARLWGIHFGFPHLNARPDEGAIVSIAGGMYNGDLNPHFFNYPALFMLAVAAAMSVLHAASTLLPWLPLPLVSDTTTAFRIARYLSAAAGIASVLLLFRIGQRLFGRPAGLASAALLAVAFLHVRDSHFGVTDVPMTFMLLLAFWFVVRISESPVTRGVIAAGVASGLAISTKYNAVLIALPALFVILIARAGHHEPFRDGLRRAVLYGCVMVGAFLLTSPFSVLDFREFLADVTFESRHLARGHGVVLGRGWIHHLTSNLRYGVGIPLLFTGLLGMLLLIARDWRKGALVALFPLSYFVLIGSGYTVFARYMIPVVPFVCLTGAYAVTEAAEWLAARIRVAQWKPAWITLGVMCLAWPSAHSVIHFNRLVSRTDSRVLVRDWLERYVPPRTTIGQLGTASGNVLLFEHDRSEVKYTRSDLRRAGSRPDVVIVNSSQIGVQDRPSARVRQILSREYEVVSTFNAAAQDEPANVYDWQDELFVPLSGFKRIERPGPNVTIYFRRGVLPGVARQPR